LKNSAGYQVREDDVGVTAADVETGAKFPEISCCVLKIRIQNKLLRFLSRNLDLE
jgi:hypothetical protein